MAIFRIYIYKKLYNKQSHGQIRTQKIARMKLCSMYTVYNVGKNICTVSTSKSIMCITLEVIMKNDLLTSVHFIYTLRERNINSDVIDK